MNEAHLLNSLGKSINLSSGHIVWFQSPHLISAPCLPSWTSNTSIMHVASSYPFGWAFAWTICSCYQLLSQAVMALILCLSEYQHPVKNTLLGCIISTFWKRVCMWEGRFRETIDKKTNQAVKNISSGAIWHSFVICAIIYRQEQVQLLWYLPSLECSI